MPPSGNGNNDDAFYKLYAGASDGDGWWIDTLEREEKERKERAQAVIKDNKKEDRGCECGVDSLPRAEDRAPLFHDSWCPVKKRSFNGY